MFSFRKSILKHTFYLIKKFYYRVRIARINFGLISISDLFCSCFQDINCYLLNWKIKIPLLHCAIKFMQIQKFSCFNIIEFSSVIAFFSYPLLYWYALPSYFIIFCYSSLMIFLKWHS